MGLKDGFMGASILMKIVCILVLIALLFIWIAFTCTGWGEDDVKDGQHLGLWRRCSSSNVIGGTGTNCVSLDGWAADWFGYVQASAIFAFVGINIAAVLVILILFSSQYKGNKEFGIGGGILCLVTGVLFLIGIIVFGANFKDYFIHDLNNFSTHDYKYSYAFGLAIPGCLCEIAVGILLLIENCKGGAAAPSG